MPNDLEDQLAPVIQPEMEVEAGGHSLGQQRKRESLRSMFPSLTQ